jgi:hypothetical protein
MPDRNLSLIRAEAGAKGAAARMLGLDVEDRRQLTAAANEARRDIGARRRAEKLAEKIAAVERILPTLSPEERERQLALIERIKGADELIAALRRSIEEQETAEQAS